MGIIDPYNIHAGRIGAVCEPGEFLFGFTGLDHGHAYGMTSALETAGGRIHAVYDPDPAKVEAFRKSFPMPGPWEALNRCCGTPLYRWSRARPSPPRVSKAVLRSKRPGSTFFPTSRVSPPVRILSAPGLRCELRVRSGRYIIRSAYTTKRPTMRADSSVPARFIDRNEAAIFSPIVSFFVWT